MGPKTTLAYETIKDRVTRGELAPGAKLPSERALSEQLDIGRTALRQVLSRLVQEGVIQVHGRSAYRVPDTSAPTPPQGLEPWRVHGRRSLYTNRWVDLELWDVEPPGVAKFEHHVVRLQHVAATAVLNDDGTHVLMLWRYRFVPDQWGWELPGGIVDEGEDPAAAARREVEEETGWRPVELEHVTTFHPAPGMVQAPHTVFVAHGADHVGEPTDAEEQGHIAWVPVAAVRGMMARGELSGCCTLVGLLHVLSM